MNYIITEEQYLKLFEEENNDRNKKKFFQELIDETLNYILESCNISFSEFQEIVYNFDESICDRAEIISKIEVKNYNFFEGRYIIDVRVEYNSIKSHFDMSDVLHQISKIMKYKTGIKFFLYEEENVNLNIKRG